MPSASDPGVGTGRTPDNGYFRTKFVQEKLIVNSGFKCL
jgi:thioester reductase-like protein